MLFKCALICSYYEDNTSLYALNTNLPCEARLLNELSIVIKGAKLGLHGNNAKLLKKNKNQTWPEALKCAKFQGGLLLKLN